MPLPFIVAGLKLTWQAVARLIGDAIVDRLLNRAAEALEAAPNEPTPKTPKTPPPVEEPQGCERCYGTGSVMETDDYRPEGVIRPCPLCRSA